jgi:hypothetical protein
MSLTAGAPSSAALASVSAAGAGFGGPKPSQVPFHYQ